MVSLFSRQNETSMFFALSDKLGINFEDCISITKKKVYKKMKIIEDNVGNYFQECFWKNLVVLKEKNCKAFNSIDL